MATSVTPRISKASFAKVAASSSSQNTPPTLMASSASSFEIVGPPSTGNASIVSLESQSAAQSHGSDSSPVGKDSLVGSDIKAITEAVKTLQVKDDVSQSFPKPSDEAGTHETTSETSWKRPPSLDGKSVASATTFALDEKESLRPDDSASVKAAEEEDSLSPLGSVLAGSRVGSEAGARAFRDQFHELSQRMENPTQRAAASSQVAPLMRAPLDNAAAGLPPKPVTPALNTTIGPDGVPHGFTKSDPDEKLLEALDSPKDRLFLLRLEQELIEFVKDSEAPLLDLPPCNSFCRLLIHKLADYYYLTHFVDATLNSVRIYRTPFCRLPPPLTGISNPPTSGNTPPPSVQAMKIMRRGFSDTGDGKQGGTGNGTEFDLTFALDSIDQQGGTGASASDAAVPKDKSNMTREERENAYKEARERIFKGFEGSGEDAQPGEDSSKEVSRSSSGAGKTKAQGKKRSFRDDGFEARSQFAAFYPTAPLSVQPYQTAPPFQTAPPYGPYPTSPVNFGASASGTNMMGGPAQYGAGYPMMAPQHSPMTPFQPSSPQPYAGPHGTAQGRPGSYSQPVAPQQSPTVRHLEMHSPYMPMNSPQAYPYGQVPRPDNQHQPGYYGQMQSQHSSPDRQGWAPQGSPHGGSYPYGRLPNQMNAHPVPGSYNRNAFNPQTHPFVPQSSPPNQAGFYPPMPMNVNGGPGMQQPYGSPSLGPYATIQSDPGQPVPYPTQGYMNGGQNGGGKLPSRPTHYNHNPYYGPDLSSTQQQHGPHVHHPQHQFQNPHPHPHQHQNPHQHPLPHPPPLQNTLSKWGTPPTLPPKPPAPSVPTPPSVPPFNLGDQRSGIPAKVASSSQGYAAAVKNSLPPNPNPTSLPPRGPKTAAADTNGDASVAAAAAAGSSKTPAIASTPTPAQANGST